jgi:hypothetical protein
LTKHSSLRSRLNVEVGAVVDKLREETYPRRRKGVRARRTFNANFSLRWVER